MFNHIIATINLHDKQPQAEPHVQVAYLPRLLVLRH